MSDYSRKILHQNRKFKAGDIVYFLEGFPCNFLREIKLIDKEDDGRWFFQYLDTEGHDKTREDFLLPIPNNSKEFPSIMKDDEAFQWAWEQVKKDCDLKNLTVGESVNFRGFMRWGWRYREQLAKQRSDKERGDREKILSKR